MHHDFAQPLIEGVRCDTTKERFKVYDVQGEPEDERTINVTEAGVCMATQCILRLSLPQ
jgi:hypothetical protein